MYITHKYLSKYFDVKVTKPCVFFDVRCKAGIINNPTLVIIFNIFSYKTIYTAILSYINIFCIIDLCYF